MKSLNFNQQVIKTIQNEKTSIEELKSIEPILIENCKSSVRLFYNYYFFTFLIIIIWFLINNSIISEVKVFDVTINNRKILLLSLPFISTATYYITISYLAFNQLIDAGLKEIQRKIYPSIGESSLLELMIYPSLIELESIKVRLSNDSFISTLGFIIISLSFIFLPIVLNSIICYNLLIMLRSTYLIIFPIIYSLIILKTIKNFIFYFKQVQ